MIIRSKAPLRLGLAGGGSDVSPYSDIYGGLILNATINLYAYCTIEETKDNLITICGYDSDCFQSYPLSNHLEIDGKASLIKGVYNRVIKETGMTPRSFKITTYNDAPAGSGLGTSSTMVVCILKCFAEWLSLPLGDYEIARLAYEIERKDLGLSGGKQDQYAAAFGGFNFMEFNGSKVLVNPLRIRKKYINELEFNILLYYTGTSRLSAKIIESQAENAKNKNEKAIDAMHQLKKQSYDMKEALLMGQLSKMGDILNDGWENKKRMSSAISNPMIDNIYETAIKAGASGGKISGAGGGGFFMFYCPKNSRYKVIEELQKLGGEFRRFRFTNIGAESWTIE